MNICKAFFSLSMSYSQTPIIVSLFLQLLETENQLLLIKYCVADLSETIGLVLLKVKCCYFKKFKAFVLKYFPIPQ